MKEECLYSVAVVGGGAAGTMAALRCVLNNDKTVFFSGSEENKKLSREAWLDKVEKIPGYSRFEANRRAPYGEAIQFLKASHFKDQLEHVENVAVTEITRADADYFRIGANNGQCYLARYVIVCTGVEYLQPSINGATVEMLHFENVIASDLGDNVESYYCKNKDIVIFGDCIESVEAAIVLHERFQPSSIQLLTNGKELQLKSDTQKLVSKYQIHLHQDKMVSFQSDGKNLTKIELANGEIIDCPFVYLLLGYDVHNELLKSLNVKYDEKGFVLANAKGETDEKGLYVSGDILQNVKKQIFTAYDRAVDSADDINMKLRVEKRNKRLEDFRKSKK